MLKNGRVCELCIRITVDVEGDPQKVRNGIMDAIDDNVSKKFTGYPEWRYEIFGIKSSIYHIDE
jgi:hypothetical protein